MLGPLSSTARRWSAAWPGQRGLLPPELPPEDPLPTLIISAAAYTSPPSTDGFIAITSKRARRNEGSITSRLKTLGYLDNVIAQSEAEAAAADEAIMLNNRDGVACGGRSNLFAVIDGILTTPAIEEGALPGITRHAVLALCKSEGLDVVEGVVTRAQLRAATEMFVTNSLLEIMPVRRCDDADLPVGAVTKQIAEAYASLTP